VFLMNTCCFRLALCLYSEKSVSVSLHCNAFITAVSNSARWVGLTMQHRCREHRANDALVRTYGYSKKDIIKWRVFEYQMTHFKILAFINHSRQCSSHGHLCWRQHQRDSNHNKENRNSDSYCSWGVCRAEWYILQGKPSGITSIPSCLRNRQNLHTSQNYHITSHLYGFNNYCYTTINNKGSANNKLVSYLILCHSWLLVKYLYWPVITIINIRMY